jgi:hypothetical protein
MGHSYERIFFNSEYEPSVGEPGRDRWVSYTATEREYALLLRHPEPRPWLVCIHGAEMGRAALDLRLFRARHLHQHLGLNVVLPVLPMHSRKVLRSKLFRRETVDASRCGTLSARLPPPSASTARSGTQLPSRRRLVRGGHQSHTTSSRGGERNITPVT